MSEPQSRLPVRAMVPNAITVLALCAGASGVRFAIAGEFGLAAMAIVVAGVLDGIDGRIARLLRGTSRFGAELDSLSDVVSFGFAPAIILYLWALNDLARWGWVIALLFAVCCALRLARFNTEIDHEDAPKKQLGFTTGVPAPAGAGMALAPLFFSLAIGDSFDIDPEVLGHIVAVTTVATSLLMVSSLPGWGWGAIHIPHRIRLFVLVGVALVGAFVIQMPWLTLFALALAYTVAFPFASLHYMRLRRTLATPPEDAR